MRLSATVTPDDFERLIERILERQLPRAYANAINATTKDVKTNTIKRIRRRFHKPVPYMTKTAVFATRAWSTRRFAIVGIKDRQAEMYRFQEKGGRRYPERGKWHAGRGGSGGKVITVPVKIRKNAHDNMARRAITVALRRKNVFQAGDEEGLDPGIYRRKRGGKLEMLVRYRKSVRYKPVFDWQDMALKTIRARWPMHLRAAIAHEIANPVFRTKRGQKRF